MPRSKSAAWTFFMSSADFKVQAAMGTGLSFISKPSFLRPLFIRATLRRKSFAALGLAATISRPLSDAAMAGVGLGVAPG